MFCYSKAQDRAVFMRARLWVMPRAQSTNEKELFYVAARELGGPVQEAHAAWWERAQHFM